VPTPAPDWTAALAHLRRVDRALAPVIKAHGAPALTPTRHPLESLGRAIVYQQLSGAAAGTIYKRFTALYRGKFPTPAALAATPEATLRACGLSFAKIRALHDLAAHVLDGRLTPRRLPTMTDAEVSAALLPVRGIGPWSVHMFQMFALCRPDILPTGDLGVQKGMQRHFGLRRLPTPERMAALAAPWRPFRTVGAWYMWRVLEGAA
jgi:DNA-3-methyladenine glycosylase II